MMAGTGAAVTTTAAPPGSLADCRVDLSIFSRMASASAAVARRPPPASVQATRRTQRRTWGRTAHKLAYFFATAVCSSELPATSAQVTCGGGSTRAYCGLCPRPPPSFAYRHIDSPTLHQCHENCVYSPPSANLYYSDQYCKSVPDTEHMVLEFADEEEGVSWHKCANEAQM